MSPAHRSLMMSPYRLGITSTSKRPGFLTSCKTSEEERNLHQAFNQKIRQAGVGIVKAGIELTGTELFENRHCDATSDYRYLVTDREPLCGLEAQGRVDARFYAGLLQEQVGRDIRLRKCL